MKTIYIIFVTLLLSYTAFAQGGKTGWKELDTFHDMVPKYLHTAAAGEVKPIKENSSKLLAAAKAWQNSTAPKGSDTPKYKADLAELAKECAELDTAVKENKPDTELSALADKTHKTFHMVLAETVVER